LKNAALKRRFNSYNLGKLSISKLYHHNFYSHNPEKEKEKNWNVLTPLGTK
jgi:hypothetical protein